MHCLKWKRKILMGLSGLAGCVAGAYFSENTTDGNKMSQFVPITYANEKEQLTKELIVASNELHYNWDKSGPLMLMKGLIDSETDENKDKEKQEKAKPSATRHVLLVRHGHYNAFGKSDTLTAFGREQANLVGLRLKELAHPYTRIIQSTMTSATETGQIISHHLPGVPVKGCDLIREVRPIEPVTAYSEYTPEKHREFIAEGARIETAFRKYFRRADPQQKEDSYDVIVCHANVIRYFICRAIQLPPEAWLRFPGLFHGSLTWIIIKPYRFVGVVSVGDMGHMPKDKLSLFNFNQDNPGIL